MSISDLPFILLLMHHYSEFSDLSDRARDIFRHIVESFISDGNPVGSRTISRQFDLSPATIRNVMADLEYMGLLKSPHISAGRLPTDTGLRYFLDGILEIGDLNDTERAAIEEEYSSSGQSVNNILEQTSTLLSGLSSCAGLVAVPKMDKAIRHIEFVSLDPQRALVILVPDDGMLENRIMDLPPGITPDILKTASLFLSERLHGRTMNQMRSEIMNEITARRSELGELTTKAIEAGLAIEAADGSLIVKGQANLLDQSALDNLDHIKTLLEQLESKETVSRILEEAGTADGVKIFVGAENPVFNNEGYSLVLAPYKGGGNNIVGAIGVIGPMRINYAKIIPSINYTAELISHHLRGFKEG